MNLKEYEENGVALYEEFCQAVENIIRHAIKASAVQKIPHFEHRAKAPKSLAVKLQDIDGKDLTTSENIEDIVSDLSGCRIVFYTNNEVSAFRSSRIIHEHFDVVKVKDHEPGSGSTEANEMYTSTHFTVKLKAERAKLPEYAKFAGLKCEIQVQTILNRVWAEMAHDTIYKPLERQGLKKDVLKPISDRLMKIAQKYLIPAGYEFQKVVTDYERLVEGRAVLDEDPVLMIQKAKNNNDLVAMIEKINEVLPTVAGGDYLQAQYPKIVEALFIAFKSSLSRNIENIPTPFGDIEGKTANDLLETVLEMVGHYQYVNLSVSFQMIVQLYEICTSDDQKELVKQAADNFSKPRLEVWKDAGGPGLQIELVELIKKLPHERWHDLCGVLAPIFKNIFELELSGAEFSSEVITLKNAPIPPSEAIAMVRSNSIEYLEQCFAIANDSEKRLIIQLLCAGCMLPTRGSYKDGLLKIVLENISRIVDFFSTHFSSFTPLLKRRTERKIFDLKYRHSVLPPHMAENTDLQTAQKTVLDAFDRFSSVANADDEFCEYKTFVGSDTIYASICIRLGKS